MKTNSTLRALALGLALLSTSAGCSFFGDGSSPSIASIEPSQGRSGATVTVTVKNFNDAHDILLFGGVPVRAVGTSISDRTMGRTVTVPNLDGGTVALTIRRGGYESDAVDFTILGSSTGNTNHTSTGAGETSGDDKDNKDGDVVEPSDPGSATGGTMPGGETTGGATGGTTGGTTGSGETPPSDDTPPTDNTPPTGDTPPVEPPPPTPSTPAAIAQLSEGAFVYGLNYVKLNWSVSYVDAAFIRVPVNASYRNVIPFGQYQGSTYYPFPFGLPSGESGLLDKLAGSPLDQNYGSLPFNYCQVGAYRREIISFPCYDPNPNLTAYNYVDIMIPLASGEKFKSGTWKFRLPAKLNAFTVYYRDWSKNVSHKDLKILRPF